MKALIVVAVAAGFMGTMGLAQAGVPTAAGAAVAKAAGGHEAAVMSPDIRQDQSTSGKDSSKPGIPGAHEAQSNALSHGQEMAIAGGVILAVGVGLLVSDNGSSHSNTPGTGGTGTTGTTGTN